MEINQFKKDGAILIKGKFDNLWIEKLREGIKKALVKCFQRYLRQVNSFINLKH